VIAGDVLNREDELTRIGEEFHINTPISSSLNKLTDALFALEETGSDGVGSSFGYRDRYR